VTTNGVELLKKKATYQGLDIARSSKSWGHLNKGTRMRRAAVCKTLVPFEQEFVCRRNTAFCGGAWDKVKERPAIVTVDEAAFLSSPRHQRRCTFAKRVPAVDVNDIGCVCQETDLFRAVAILRCVTG